MTANELQRGLCLAALVVLALGLAACGGSEPAPAARAPAPAPAPPPFQPEPVEVALGASGERVTLMTKEGGGFTLNGEDFTGGDLKAESGATYTLTLADGKWAAAFKPAEVTVALGASGESLTLMTKEGGGFTLNGADFTGGEVTASGMTYMVTLGADGMPAAAFKPQPVAVPLGASGESVTLMTKEGGGYTLNGEDFAGGTLTASSGGTYLVSLGADGMWTARFQASSVMVMLGASGGSVTVTRNEDGSYWIGETALMSGDMVTGSNGASYTLTMDAEGMWSASFNPAAVTVALGTSGSVTLMTTEAGGWTLSGAAFMSGSTYTASNGNVYVLSLSGGSWSAVYQPMTMPVAGTGLVATSLEDGTGYQVGSSRLPKSGVGDVTVDGAMYHVWMDAGVLAGARFEGAIDSDTVVTTVKTPATATAAAVRLASPTLSADNTATVANELGTMLTLGGTDFPVSELLGTGMSMARGKNFAAEARKGLENLLLDARALIRALGESNPATLATQLQKLWGTHTASNPKNAQKYVNTLFGTTGTTTPAPKVALSAALGDREDIEGALGKLISALSSADAFAAATAEDGGGVFAAAKLSGSAAATAFAATDSESRASLGMTGPTRYGTITKKVRNLATGPVVATRTIAGTASPPKWVAVTAANGNTWTGVKKVTTRDRDNNPVVAWDVVSSGQAVGESVPTASSSSGTGAPIVLSAEPQNDAASRTAIQNAVNAIFDAGNSPTVRANSVTSALVSGAVRFSITISGRSPVNAWFKKVQSTTPATTTIAGETGAFAYSTGPETDRMRFVNTSGNAYYKGGTRATTGDGKLYTGDMDLTIRFGTKRVDGLVTNLRDADGNAWQHFYGDVARIVLPSATARDGNAGVNWSSAAGATATLAYGRSAGRPTPTTVAASFSGKLLGGSGADAGSHATGVWTLGGGPAAGAGYLAGGYGVERVADRPDRAPEEVDAVTALAIVSKATDNATAAIADGKLRVTGRNYSWLWNEVTASGTTTTGLKWSYLALPVQGARRYRNYTVDLQAAYDNEGLETNTNGSRHVELLRGWVQILRDDLASLIGRNILPDQQGAKWRQAQFVIGTQLFAIDGTDTYASNTWTDNRTTKAGFPDKLDGSYDKDVALDLLDRVLDALSSSDALAAALQANGGGIFTTDSNQPETAVAAATLWGRRRSQVKTFLGVTDFTRFGVWRIQNGSSAVHGNDQHQREMGRFAYSALSPTVVSDTRQPGYTTGGTATYVGKTVLTQAKQYYTGDARVTANWRATSANKPEGLLAVQFSSLANAETGAPLNFWLMFDPTGSPPPELREYMVRSLVFSNIKISSEATSNRILFDDPPGTGAANDIKMKVVATDRSLPEITEIGVGGSATAKSGAAMTERTVSGLFVGQNAEGPVALIGEWSLGAKKIPSTGRVANDIQIGTGDALQAAFGAELPSP